MPKTNQTAIEQALRISIGEMIEDDDIERIGCGEDNPDINSCVVRICGELRHLQDELAKLKKPVFKYPQFEAHD